jgi:CP12 domain
MMLKAVVLASWLLAAQAFAPLSVSRPSTGLYNERPDASQAIKDAMAASEKFGATSKEARVAWDAVEEMDASDNR